MNNGFVYLLAVILLALGVWGGMAFSARRKRVTAFASINDQAQEKKDAAKKKITEWISERGEMSNDDVQALVGVSDATATRYLHELVEEGAIIQRGERGRGIYYVPKRP